MRLPPRLRPLRHFCTTPPLYNSTPPSPAPPPSPLQRHLYNQIRFHGPLTFADYMRACLTHPTHGYYTTHPTPLGPRGDFTTSPQISPVFGELLAAWIAHFTAGAPYDLVELGPGTGALLAAALPALRKLRAAPVALHLVERSDPLRALQKTALDAPAVAAPPIAWAASLHDLLDAPRPPRPRVFLLHEFLDALPVHAFQRVPLPSPSGATVAPRVWRERLIDVVLGEGEGEGEGKGGEEDAQAQARLRAVVARDRTPGLALLEQLGGVGGEGDDVQVAEVGGEAAAVVERLAGVIREEGGGALIVDYGKEGGVGDSVRAFKGHRQVDVLSEPGLCDVTADVDFAMVRRVAEASGVRVWGPATQRRFLLSVGAAARFRRVALGVVERGGDAVDARLARLQGDYDRLVGRGAGEMGEAYHVAVLARDGARVAGAW